MSKEKERESFSLRQTTDHFNQFKKYYKVENDRQNRWDSDEIFLVKYIIQCKKSPFIGDDSLDEARKFLKEQGVKEEII